MADNEEQVAGETLIEEATSPAADENASEDAPTSISSPDVMGEDAPRRNRESIRARLRAQEQRLSSIVRSASGDGMGILGQMKATDEALKKMEEEKTKLESELDKLRNATDDDEFLKEKMGNIQEGFEKQVNKIQSLQSEVDAKNNEIDILRNELVAKLQRIVELEFDLSTHDIHFTNYAAEQFKLGEEALAEIKSTAEPAIPVDASETSAGETNNKPLTAKRAQKLISKLLADLDSLEVRYKEEKLRAASTVERMKIENSDLKTRVEILENRIRDSSDGGNNGNANDSGMQSMEQQNLYALRKRCENAEAKCSMQKKELALLKQRVATIKTDAKDDQRRQEIDLEHLHSENEALKARLREVEDKKDSKKKFLGGKKKEDKGKEVYGDIEERIKKHYVKLVQMESSIEIKNKQIGTLKNEVTNLRMREISEGKTKDTSYSKRDTDLLRAAPSRSRSYDGDMGDGTNGQYLMDLQKQLQEAQQQLVKKDQELVIERAKAASTAAGLLARITELTGRKADEKGSKQVPLRFYL
jgi:conjugal transfer/entry exclusion protein